MVNRTLTQQRIGLVWCFIGCMVIASTANAQETAGVLRKVLVQQEAKDSERASDRQLWERLIKRSPWIFLGDSNTYAGGYIAVLDAWLEPLENRPKLLNLGVSSETAAGTSEADHPFKRPCVHERLDKVLSMTSPGVVFICYGMNDGIYQPANPELLEAYKAGMSKLADKVHAAGAELVCLTPPIFEPEPVAAGGRLGPSSEGRYAYFAPAADYDKALEQQAEWCLRNEIEAVKVIDVHAMLHREKSQRKQSEPDFKFSKDGIHFGAEAHALVAEQILVNLGAPRELSTSYPDNASIALATGKQRILRDAYLSATGKNRPGLPAGQPIWFAEKWVGDRP
jgi:lysophospholipase L1-like esterase